MDKVFRSQIDGRRFFVLSMIGFWVWFLAGMGITILGAVFLPGFGLEVTAIVLGLAVLAGAIWFNGHQADLLERRFKAEQVGWLRSNFGYLSDADVQRLAAGRKAIVGGEKLKFSYNDAVDGFQLVASPVKVL